MFNFFKLEENCINKDISLLVYNYLEKNAEFILTLVIEMYLKQSISLEKVHFHKKLY